MYQVSVDDDDVWCWSPIRSTINMMWQFRRFSRRYWLWHWRGSTWPNPITPPPRGRWCRNGITPGDWDVDAGNRESWKQFAKSSRLPIAHQDYNAVTVIFVFNTISTNLPGFTENLPPLCTNVKILSHFFLGILIGLWKYAKPWWRWSERGEMMFFDKISVKCR